MRNNNNKLVPFITKSLKKSILFAHKRTPTMLALITIAFRAIRKPIMAAKAAFYRNTELQETLKQIPWIPVTLIVFGGMILMHKDLNFNFNLTSSIGNTSTPISNGYAQSTSNSMMLFSAQQDEKNRKYIAKYKSIAIAEMKATGIPASINLAQAIVSSKAGESEASIKNNNHFGLKCFSKKCKSGHCSNLEDMGHKAFYIKYASVWESWRAHSQLISSGKYERLLQNSDYQSWARGLQQFEYSQSENYATQLVQLIQHYGLEQLD